MFSNAPTSSASDLETAIFWPSLYSSEPNRRASKSLFILDLVNVC